MNFIVIAMSALYILSAVIVLVTETGFQSVIWFGVMGSLSAIIMLIIGAPDVAMTQFTVGVALVLIVYIMALRKQRRVRLGYLEVPSMIENTPAGLTGLEWEILQRIDEKEGYHIEASPIQNIKAGIEALERHELDLLCGALTQEYVSDKTQGIPYLETSIFLLENREIDFVRLKHNSRSTLVSTSAFHRKSNYVFIVSKNSQDLARDLLEGLEEMKETGQLEEVVGRYL